MFVGPAVFVPSAFTDRSAADGRHLGAVTTSFAANARRAPARLMLFLVQHLAGFHIDQMHAGASDAFHRLIGVIIVAHLIGGPSLHVLAGVWAPIEKRPRHRAKIAQTKREKPQPDGAGAKFGKTPIDIQAECSAGVKRKPRPGAGGLAGAASLTFLERGLMTPSH